MSKRRTIRELWSEGRDLHVIFDDTGEHVVFNNAWFVNEKAVEDTTIVTEEWPKRRMNDGEA